MITFQFSNQKTNEKERKRKCYYTLATIMNVYSYMCFLGLNHRSLPDVISGCE
jgi:hypothetical protein